MVSRKSLRHLVSTDPKHNRMIFGVVEPQSGRVLVSFHKRCRNTDSPEYKEDQQVLKTVGFPYQMVGEKGLVGSVSQHSHDDSFLVSSRSHP